jgi:DNA uptake protein ComE-like DNA-binding protein
MREQLKHLLGIEKVSTNRKMEKLASPTMGFRDSTGLSLISTLWILTILSVLAWQMLYSFQLETRAQGNFIDRTKYYYAAKSGFEWGIAKLAIDETNFDSLGETWAEPVQHEIEDGVQIGGFLSYQVAITDEASRVNINEADESHIRNLLSMLGTEPENNETGDLAARIVEGRPYRTVRDVARIKGMTNELLYGIQQQAAAETEGDETDTIQPPVLSATSIGGLVNMVTVYSVDANTDANGQQRVNINTAQAQQLSQIRSNNNQTVFSQSEANAIIQQREFNSMAGLLDVSAISDQVFNNIRNRITIEDTPEDNNGEDGERQGSRGNGNSLININSADSGELQELQGIDNGIANRIIAHRNSQGDFQNIDAIRDVKIMTMQEFAGIVDKITTKDGQTVNGLININTAPLEILQLLPGMDQTKAQAIITRREEENPDAQNSSEQQIRGNPFSNIAQLLDIEEIDDQSFREVVDWVTYRSHGYRIVSAGIDVTGKTLATCVGIVVRSGNQLAVQYWRQD